MDKEKAPEGELNARLENIENRLAKLENDREQFIAAYQNCGKGIEAIIQSCLESYKTRERISCE